MSQKQPRILHLMPSLTDVAFLLPIAVLFVCLNGVKTLLGDGDTGWHVRTGEWILAHHRIPSTDLFSFTKPGQPWFAWEWLWDLGFGWLHLHWGLAAVVIASLVVICVTSVATFRLILLLCPNRLIAITVTALAATGCSIHWLARPHLFTILFAALWLQVLERAKRNQETLLWILPIGTVLWTNLHGGFLAGIILTVTYALGSALDAMFSEGKADQRVRFRLARLYLGAALLSLLCSLVNPYGWALYRHLAEYLSDSTQMDQISEFQSISFHEPSAKLFELMLLLAVLAGANFLRRRQFTPALLIATWAHLALVSARHIPLFYVAASPFVAAMLYDLVQCRRAARMPRAISNALGVVEQVDDEIEELEKVRRLHTVALASVALLCLTISVNATNSRLRAQYDAKLFPVAAVRRLATTGFTHRIFSTDQWGDYLTYCLYPRGRVFIDGRSDFYGGHFLTDYLDVVQARYRWQTRLDQYRVDMIVVPTKSAIAEVAKFSTKWRVVYDDGTAIIFASTAPANKFPQSKGENGEVRLLQASVR